MRQGGQQGAVLEARGLALGGVHHHDSAAPTGGYGAHLHGARKGGATLPAQARALDALDQRPRRATLAPAVRQRRLAVHLHVLGQGHQPLRGDVGQQTWKTDGG